jgi:four helix bundle protein
MESYKRLIAWQRASGLSLAALEAVDEAWTPRAGAVLEQLRRAALSPDLNIVEGFALNTVPLFRRHLRIAIGSAAETERLISIAAKRQYLPADVVHRLEPMVDQVLGTLIGLIRSPNLRRNLDR